MAADLVKLETTAAKIHAGFTTKKGIKTHVMNPFPIGTRAVYVFLSNPNGKISANALQKMCVFYGIEI